jgi:hypothetical protein
MGLSLCLAPFRLEYAIEIRKRHRGLGPFNLCLYCEAFVASRRLLSARKHNSSLCEEAVWPPFLNLYLAFS